MCIPDEYLEIRITKYENMSFCMNYQIKKTADCADTRVHYTIKILLYVEVKNLVNAQHIMRYCHLIYFICAYIVICISG
jgi:hypothetical protein